MSPTDWQIRRANEEDTPFIYSTWLNSYRYGSDIGKSCRNSIYYQEYTKVIDLILSRDYGIVNVACMPDDQNIIFGYAVLDIECIHYVFVKDAFRRKGIAKSLLESFKLQGQVITHRTKCIEPYLKMHQDIIYNPFKLFNNKEKKDATSSSNEESFSKSSSALLGT